MLRHAFASPKLAALARKLELPRYAAVGVLEHLWYFTATQAPRGDIGRWSDEEIAAAIDWERNSAELIEALIATRWIDRCQDHRLLVHDWVHHADRNVKGAPQVKEHGFAQLRSGADLSQICPAPVYTEVPLSSLPEPEPEPEPEPVLRPEAPADAGAASSDDSRTEPPADQAPDPAEGFPPEAVQFAEDFRAAMHASDPRWAPPSSAAFVGWCRDSRALLNKRGAAEPPEIARWLFNGNGSNADFWRGVVLSPGKFREKYDQLRKAKKRDETGPVLGAGRPAGRVGPLAAIAEIQRRREAAREQSG